MTLDEATADLLEIARRSGAPALHEQTPEEARTAAAGRGQSVQPGPAMESVRETTAPRADGGEVPLRLLVPRAEPRGVLVYFHGGGWVVGTVDQFDPLGRDLAERTGCAVVMVTYRKAGPAACDRAAGRARRAPR